ncbi:hypothetical protein BU16DRAFT_547285 [Lophium mytilinum]|uniref:N-acetyltransferase domain-containing protein n=1 Tax=Lophium mytilinum TaxID=390894 RepID=A0A6A6R7R4_9PEZI|nr:hypothetical protein BU16DRAFT_547285 [Lophium mytilinum]
MPAMLDDPTAAIIYRTSGEMPYPTAGTPLPLDIIPRQVILRDRVTTATLLPFSSPDQVPVSLVAYLSDQLNREIEKGDTYPMITPLPLESFGPYWFGVFGAVMLLGDIQSPAQLLDMERQGRDWDKECLGSFYIKPNYPGRSSHVCNAGFIVTDGARNRGVGRLMGECYLDWAPKLGYTYSVFNLVYETNVASCRIWDALGFKRIGRVKGAGNLKSYPDEPVDAIIYGRSLGGDDDFVSEERFDKIRYYLKYDKYPDGADRAEKSRLRSASLHYSLIPASGDEPEKLMLKGKEVIPDPQKQYEIARTFHLDRHGGINKTTAAIAEKYHWVRIKETVSQVIRHCSECGEPSKAEPPRPAASARPQTSRQDSAPSKAQSPSPSQQLQQEASGASLPEIEQQLEAYGSSTYQVPEPVYYRDGDMPVDPQLMNPPLDHPPSPFLSATLAKFLFNRPFRFSTYSLHVVGGEAF